MSSSSAPPCRSLIGSSSSNPMPLSPHSASWTFQKNLENTINSLAKTIHISLQICTSNQLARRVIKWPLDVHGTHEVITQLPWKPVPLPPIPFLHQQVTQRRFHLPSPYRYRLPKLPGDAPFKIPSHTHFLYRPKVFNEPNQPSRRRALTPLLGEELRTCSESRLPVRAAATHGLTT